MASNDHDREVGADWPARAVTMVGLQRLGNVKLCVESVLTHEVLGDSIESGAWRGTTSIFMRVLKAHGVSDRKLCLHDSSQGLLPPDASRYPAELDAKPGPGLLPRHVLPGSVQIGCRAMRVSGGQAAGDWGPPAS